MECLDFIFYTLKAFGPDDNLASERSQIRLDQGR